MYTSSTEINELRGTLTCAALAGCRQLFVDNYACRKILKHLTLSCYVLTVRFRHSDGNGGIL